MKTGSNGNDVSVALEIVLEEVEAVANGVIESGIEALKAAELDRARATIEQATRLEAYRGRVKELQREWTTLFAPVVSAQATERAKANKTFGKKAPKGLRTPEDAYRRPLLEALVELGGSGKTSVVVDLVGRKVQELLNDYDRQPLHSNPKELVWRNNVQWCRNTLANKDGLMRSDSPHGLWEISEAGREALRANGV
jgi:hypothetical protein